MRAICDAGELSVGNESPTGGLLTTWPAARFWFSFWMNEFRSGGHEHGILMGWPLGPLTAPSQSPVEIGYEYHALMSDSKWIVAHRYQWGCDRS
jgi:hypothetical protein